MSSTAAATGTAISDDVLIRKSGGLMTIQLNRPTKLNAIKQEMYHVRVS